MMFKRLLVVNRGEIAVRIIRSCAELGIETVAVYSEGDEESLHTLLADKAICIGPDEPLKSYLQIEKIIDVAKIFNVDAIHPGYGLLSENYCFARTCREEGIVFIGPSEENILLFGDKSKAKRFVQDIGVPTIVGSEEINDISIGKKIAEEIGYPVLLKLSNGGGGKGIRVVEDASEFENKYNLCSYEGKKSEEPKLYVEKFIKNARHIEVQVLRDVSENCICLGERDCTLQRRYQKVIEESPASILNENLRKQLYVDATKIANESKFINVGTIEFLIDEYGNHYFIEVNPRIQVEHTVTEMLYDIDIVKEQINIALGSEISYKNKTKDNSGHVIECRVNAETPINNFIPSSGQIEKLHFPGGNGIRIDSALYNGCKVQSVFDSNIAKIIVKSDSRANAITKMRRALSETVITGVNTNLKFLQNLLSLDAIISNSHNTRFIESYLREVNMIE